MKPIALFVALLLLLPAVGQDSDSNLGRDHSQWCRSDENDSADCTTPPRATYAPDPEYPLKERKTGHEGSVILRLVVDAAGMAHDITVSESLSPAFDAAALEAVKKWTFSPAVRNGKPVSANLAVQVQFHYIRRK